MRQLIIGNWKMHGTRDQALKLATELADAAPMLSRDLVICPPFPLLYPIALALDGTGIGLGGQDCHAAASGAFTGETAAGMLVDAGAGYVILGHSERRQFQGETSEQVCAKTEAALRAGLIPIVCVGESEAQRRDGLHLDTILSQLRGSLPDKFNGIVSYEPIWAIGTGLTPTTEDIAEMHGQIRAELIRRFGKNTPPTPILYGGSVKPTNAAGILAIPNVGGALVGGASLIAETFLGIARA